MPWLEKGHSGKNADKNLLFVHVPRCGGTSLMQSHDVPSKSASGSSIIKNIGMKTFFHRYKLLETTNFPVWTLGNAACLAIAGMSAYWKNAILVDSDSDNADMYRTIANFITVFFTVLTLSLTYVFVAPTICRFLWVRRFFLVMVQYVLWGAMESIEWLTGTNIHGYLPHLTAHKMLHYKYVTPSEMETVSSLAIVRNPYSRMVSIYMYNRFGQYESFPHFVRSWYRNTIKPYRESGEMEEWYTPCHALPMYEYTHFEGAQLVQSIVKQEELKYLKQKGDIDKIQDSSVRNLPETVREALLGMPHTNKRKTSKPWYEYYDQETLELTYKLYQVDFEIFEYPSTIPQRPDLKAPKVSKKLAESIARSRVALEQSMSNTIAEAAQTIDDGQQQQKQATKSQTLPFVFESFSRNAASMTASANNNKSAILKSSIRRTSLLASAAGMSARRSSMMLESSVRDLLGGDLFELFEEDDEVSDVTHSSHKKLE